MTEAEDLTIPGHVSTKKAARMLGISYERVYQLIRARRLVSKRVSNMLFVPIESIEQFKRNPTGRVRARPPRWRIYRGGGELLATEIHVPVRSGQGGQLHARLQVMRESQRHTLTGSIARYVLVDRANPEQVSIWLAWKDTEMPDEETREAELEALRAALADVLDWSRANYSEMDGIIYT